MGMRTRTVAVLLAVLVAVPLGACAGESGDDGPTAGPTTGAPSAPPSLRTPILPTLPTSPSLPPRDGEQTISGEVTAGVEPGCVLLATDAGDYLLFGDPVEQLQMGGTTTLRGRVRPDMASTCQQGTPFEVLEVLD
jgi:hypothetical protein